MIRGRVGALLLLAPAAGCFEGSDIPRGVDQCTGNTAPFVGNLTVDSFCADDEGNPCPPTVNPFDPQEITIPAEDPPTTPPDGFQWRLLVGFTMADPGLSGATDLPNLVGGFLTVMTLGSEPATRIFWPTTQPGDPEPPSNAIPLDPTASQVELLLEYYHEGEGPWRTGEETWVQVYVYDACDAPANELYTRYTIGTGPIALTDG